MANAQTMQARDAIYGSRAECYLTIDGQRINFMSATNIKATFEKNKVEVPILGRVMKGNKAAGGKGTGSAEFHYNTSIFRELMLKYMETGEDCYFDMQITNEDPTSSVGRQTTILKDCNIDSAIMAQVNAEDEILMDEFDFTFERVQLPETFATMDGMQ